MSGQSVFSFYDLSVATVPTAVHEVQEVPQLHD